MREHQLAESKYKSLIGRLLKRLREEGDEEMVNLLNPTEDDAIEIWPQRENARKKFLKKVSIEDRLEGLSIEDRLEGLSPEQIAELTRLAAEKNKPSSEKPALE